MRIVKSIGLAAAAALAMSAVATASASAALPELSVSKGALTGEATTKHQVFLTNNGEDEWLCGATTMSGEIENPKEVHMLMSFTECKGPVGTTCTSPGAEAGVIDWLLIGKLGYINAAEERVGILLAGDEANGGLAAEFTCEVIGLKAEIKVRGSIICLVGPVNTPTESFTVTCETENGEQLDTAFEGEPAGSNILEAESKGAVAFGWSPMSIQSTFLVHTEEGVEAEIIA